MKILLGESSQNAIEAARYYSKNNHEIILAVPESSKNRPYFFYSRYISKVIRYDSGSSDLKEIQELKKIYEEESCDIFFPFNFELVTKYISVISKNEDYLMNTPYLKGKGYWRLTDKDELYNTATNTNLILPKKICKITGNNIKRIELINYPIIIKRTQGAGIIDNIYLAFNFEEAKKFILKYYDIKAYSNEFLIQEYIPGEGFDVGGFAVNGELYYAVPQRRTITLPLRGGVAAVNDIYPDKKLINLASEIVREAGWTGPFQAEFKWNHINQKYYLIEVNAKMWGSTPLSLLSNPDILNIALNVAKGNKPKKSLEYKTDIRFRWICTQELLSIYNGDLEDFYGFIKRFFKKANYDFNIYDPIPSILNLYCTINRIIFKKSKIPKPLINKKRLEEYYK